VRTFGCLVVLALPSAAGAAIVFERDNAIWVMNDDGTDQRRLVGAMELGLDSVHNPHVLQTGGTAVVFDGFSHLATNNCGFLGGWARGIYKIENAQVTRLSTAHQPGLCATHFEKEPEVTADRRVIYWNDFCSSTCNEQVNARSLDPPSVGPTSGPGATSPGTTRRLWSIPHIRRRTPPPRGRTCGSSTQGAGSMARARPTGSSTALPAARTGSRS
jgi:hypothetical protein